MAAFAMAALVLSSATTVFAQEATWAALAANEHGAWGYAVGKNSRDAAVSGALQGCGSDGAGGCRLQGVYQARCVAYVESHAGGYWYGTGIGPTMEAALSTARSGCGAGAPGGTCQVRKTVCG